MSQVESILRAADHFLRDNPRCSILIYRHEGRTHVASNGADHQGDDVTDAMAQAATVWLIERKNE